MSEGGANPSGDPPAVQRRHDRPASPSETGRLAVLGTAEPTWPAPRRPLTFTDGKVSAVN